jgi:hypothetical protein
VKIKLEQAEQVAGHALKAKIEASAFLAKYEFGELFLRSENDHFWTFCRGSEQLFDEGYVPGAVYACVSKRDGHVLSDQEIEEYYLEVERREMERRRSEPATRVA